jgi:UTP--glucose-1-phosphate uridylyltransferase
MLTVIDKPLIQFAVEEAVAAGVTQLIFVTGRTKRAIADHFDATPELDRLLRDKGKAEVAMRCAASFPRRSPASTSASPRPWAWAMPWLRRPR